VFGFAIDVFVQLLHPFGVPGSLDWGFGKIITPLWGWLSPLMFWYNHYTPSGFGFAIDVFVLSLHPFGLGSPDWGFCIIITPLGFAIDVFRYNYYTPSGLASRLMFLYNITTLRGSVSRLMLLLQSLHPLEVMRQDIIRNKNVQWEAWRADILIANQ
jgi:hypothetical protein